MRKITNLTFVFVLVTIMASAQIQVPQPSSAGSVYSKVGLTDVTIEYFRPKVKGRKIFGSGDDYLQQYGTTWRTGANSGSKLTISTDVKIAGQEVKAGTYLILTVPNANEWDFMLYSDVSIGGNVGNLKEENIALKAKVEATKPASMVETLTFQISDISEDNKSANIEFAWADASFKVPVEVEYSNAVERQINGAYTAAANYYLEKGENLETALMLMDLYLGMGNNSAQFWHIHTKARILAAMGKKKEAIATAEDSKKKASEYASGDFGYIKRNEDLIKSLK